MSFPLATSPLSSIFVSVTFTITLLLLSVGSFFRAPSICERSWSASFVPAWLAACPVGLASFAIPELALPLGLVLVLMPLWLC